MLKKDIRNVYTEKRNALLPLQHREFSEKIIHLFRQRNWDAVKVLMSFYPIIERNEFNVAACEIELLSVNPDIINTHPVITADGLNMDATVIRKDTIFALNRYNIPEPQNSVVIDPLNIDCIFIPLLAFDLKGYRVGYGKGFYDKFLAKCRPDAIKLGFSFFDPIPSIGDINQFDVPLNLCITPLRVYEF